MTRKRTSPTRKRNQAWPPSLPHSTPVFYTLRRACNIALSFLWCAAADALQEEHDSEVTGMMGRMVSPEEALSMPRMQEATEAEADPAVEHGASEHEHEHVVEHSRARATCPPRHTRPSLCSYAAGTRLYSTWKRQSCVPCSTQHLPRRIQVAVWRPVLGFTLYACVGCRGGYKRHDESKRRQKSVKLP